MKKTAIFCILMFVMSLFLVQLIQSQEKPVHPVKPGVKLIDFKLIYPNGGEVWEKGKSYTIRWLARGVEGDLKIKLRWGSGNDNIYNICSGTPNTGSFQYNVPVTGIAQQGNQFRVCIMSLDGKFKDCSDQPFQITSKVEGSKAIARPETGHMTGPQSGQANKIDRMEQLDMQTQNRIKNLRQYLGEKNFVPSKVKNEWESIIRELSMKNKIIGEKIVHEFFKPPLANTKDKIDETKELKQFSSEVYNEMKNELKKAKDHSEKQRLMASDSFEPVKLKNFENVVELVKAGKTKGIKEKGEFKEVKGEVKVKELTKTKEPEIKEQPEIKEPGSEGMRHIKMRKKTIKSADELVRYINSLESEIEVVQQKTNEHNKEHQEALDKQSQLINLMSNINKVRHDTKQAHVRNMRK